jgi:tetratricopeptide (TPR) repeat protein
MASLLDINSGTKKTIIAMLVIVGIALIYGWNYYHNLNSAYDLRVIKANKSFKTFSEKFSEHKYDEALDILDSIEKTYLNVPGYEDSYEMGVVYNNRAAVFLVQLEDSLLSTDNLKIDQRPVFLKLANKYLVISKEIYLNWLSRMEGLNKEQIKETIIPYFQPDDPSFKKRNYEKILNSRITKIEQSQVETLRRLSVVYTNLGIIERYQGNEEIAGEHYKKAIKLWPYNNVAENNLNVLLGKPIKKNSIIKQLFPPEKK